MNKRQHKKQVKKFINYVNSDGWQYITNQFFQHARNVGKASVEMKFAIGRMKKDFNNKNRCGGIK